MFFKMILMGTSSVGILCLSAWKKPELFNEAVNLGGYSISGVMLLILLSTYGIWRIDK